MEKYAKLSLNYHQIPILSVPLNIDRIIVLKFLEKRFQLHLQNKSGIYLKMVKNTQSLGQKNSKLTDENNQNPCAPMHDNTTDI